MLKDPRRKAERVQTMTFSDTVTAYLNVTIPSPTSTEILIQECPIIARHVFGLVSHQEETV